MKLTPTKEQILSAQQLFIAMAFRDIAKQEFEKMENEILQTGTYHYDDKYYSEQFSNAKHRFPDDRIMRERKYLPLLSGLSLHDKPEYKNSDCHRFYTELAKKAKETGFIYDKNAAVMAENDVMRLENELIKATYNIHQIRLDNLVSINDRRKLIDLLLNLFAAFVKNESFEINQKAFYNKRMTEKMRIK